MKTKKVSIGTPINIEHEGKPVKLIPEKWGFGNNGCNDCFFEKFCNFTEGSKYSRDTYSLACGPDGNEEGVDIIYREAKGTTNILRSVKGTIQEKIRDNEDSVNHISNTLREYINKSTHGMRLINFNLFFNPNNDAIHQYTFYLENPIFTIEDFDKVYNIEEEEDLLKKFALDVSDGDAGHIKISIITENTIQLTFII